MRLLDADALMKSMYHRAFETDGDTMWQSGCWVRYRAIEQVVKEQPTVEPTLYGYDIADLAFIAAILRKENISPTQLRSILYDIERMSRIVIADITNKMQREFKRQMNKDI